MQVDSNIKIATPSFRQTYTGPYTNDGTNTFVGTCYQFTIVVPSDVKYLFLSSPVDSSIALIKRSGTLHTFKTTTQGAVEVYGFRDAPPQASNNRSGLQVFDATGTLVFDSDSNFMKVANAFTLPRTGVRVEPWPIPGKSYAVELGVYPKSWRGASQNGFPWGVLMSYCIRVGPSAGGGGLTAIASRPWGGAGDPPPANTPEASPPTAMIMDVNNL